MIPLFRQLRQRLFQEKKISDYLGYALGEIVLVVIGILIALSINNWNEGRKDRKTEGAYYCKLLADFELDRTNIQTLYAESEYKIATSKQLLIDLEGMQKDKAFLIDNYIQSLRTNVFVPSKATISEIISSGNLNLLTLDVFKDRLLRYYAELDKYLYQLEINRTQTLDKAFSYENELILGYQYGDYVQRSLGPEILSFLPDSDWHLNKEDPYFKQFQNDLVFFVIMSEREKQHFDNILKEMDPLFTQLHELCSGDSSKPY
ncbi:hypothetical protein SAMN06265375_102236 [Muriicola jejuensis]|uniref:Uncharacterized protein n=1 Tax=Muriicola jejuensis TaxID=504488 RepID=A0A6P0UI33_9FLAO|nr:DUF6090 family protein [Muriicola jejuensis]NER10783.1 hypothetical protein [Muriicola jejuensis]SMP16258.1 hypothetical protein SAMN06265375_102236 [Muriicola jejuensis]